MGVRVAFASTDARYVDQHFGSARDWQIFDIEQEAVFVESRQTSPSCRGHCEGGFQQILETLADCDVLFVRRIGEPAAAAVIKQGKRVFEVLGSLEEVLDEILKAGLLGEGA